MKIDEFEPPARTSGTDPSAREILKLQEDLERGAVKTTLRETADSRNPGCSGK